MMERHHFAIRFPRSRHATIAQWYWSALGYPRHHFAFRRYDERTLICSVLAYPFYERCAAGVAEDLMLLSKARAVAWWAIEGDVGGGGMPKGAHVIYQADTALTAEECRALFS